MSKKVGGKAQRAVINGLHSTWILIRILQASALLAQVRVSPTLPGSISRVPSNPKQASQNMFG